MRYTILLLFTFISVSLFAQSESQYLNVADSDPEAVKIVRELRQKYENYGSMEANFRLEIDFPGQAVETQSGSLTKSGEQFHFKLGKQEGICDGKAVYVILHDNKEVQINNLPEPGEEDGMLTPQNLFSFYDQGQYILALQGEETEKGNTYLVVEMKPSDRDNSEFTKLRMLVDKKSRDMVRLLAFSRDGSRFIFHLDKVKGNHQAFSADHFAFQKADYPGYHVEDLRF
ncbi:MAG: outer membrane lipoprotein carrier protein LolA [Bacteroidota bacterium]